jgi:hypothetical protein
MQVTPLTRADGLIFCAGTPDGRYHPQGQNFFLFRQFLGAHLSLMISAPNTHHSVGHSGVQFVHERGIVAKTSASEISQRQD